MNLDIGKEVLFPVCGVTPARPETDTGLVDEKFRSVLLDGGLILRRFTTGLLCLDKALVLPVIEASVAVFSPEVDVFPPEVDEIDGFFVVPVELIWPLCLTLSRFVFITGF